MPEHPMLLVEPEDMLRRTVSLTARALGMAAIDEAASVQAAQRLLRQRCYRGAVIAIDSGSPHAQLQHDYSLLDQVRQGHSACDAQMPIAVLANRADPAMIAALRGLGVQRIILKPFRAKVLLEAFAALEK